MSRGSSCSEGWCGWRGASVVLLSDERFQMGAFRWALLDGRHRVGGIELVLSDSRGPAPGRPLWACGFGGRRGAPTARPKSKARPRRTFIFALPAVALRTGPASMLWKRACGAPAGPSILVRRLTRKPTAAGPPPGRTRGGARLKCNGCVLLRPRTIQTPPIVVAARWLRGVRSDDLGGFRRADRAGAAMGRERRRGPQDRGRRAAGAHREHTRRACSQCDRREHSDQCTAEPPSRGPQRSPAAGRTAEPGPARRQAEPLARADALTGGQAHTRGFDRSCPEPVEGSARTVAGQGLRQVLS